MGRGLYVVVNGFFDEDSFQILVKESIEGVHHFELMNILRGFRGIEKDGNGEMLFFLTSCDSAARTILYGQAQ